MIIRVQTNLWHEKLYGLGDHELGVVLGDLGQGDSDPGPWLPVVNGLGKWVISGRNQARTQDVPERGKIQFIRGSGITPFILPSVRCWVKQLMYILFYLQVNYLLYTEASS